MARSSRSSSLSVFAATAATFSVAAVVVQLNFPLASASSTVV
jgi:hypothetical protein